MSQGPLQKICIEVTVKEAELFARLSEEKGEPLRAIIRGLLRKECMAQGLIDHAIKTPITRTQSSKFKGILDFIKSYRLENNYSPSTREIQAALGMSSTSMVDYYLQKMEKQGMIRRTPNVSRSIEVIAYLSE